MSRATLGYTNIHPFELAVGILQPCPRLMKILLDHVNGTLGSHQVLTALFQIRHQVSTLRDAAQEA